MENKIDQEKVLIVVRGGVVQSIYVSNTSIHVEVLDFDNEDQPDNKSQEEELQTKARGLTAIV